MEDNEQWIMSGEHRGKGRKRHNPQHKADNKMTTTSVLGTKWQGPNYVKLGHCEK